MGAVIWAVADVHSPLHLPLLVSSINALIKLGTQAPDLFVLAGDVVDKNKIDAFKPVIEVIKRLAVSKGKEFAILSVFGNEEYMGYEAEYVNRYPEVIWLNDEVKVFRINDVELCVVGSRGLLKSPTAWQRRSMPEVVRVYEARLKTLRSMLAMCRSGGYRTILVTHYATSMATVVGESPTVHHYLGYPLIENLGADSIPHIALHGHAHRAQRVYALINGARVYNVSLPARKAITLISVNGRG